MAALLFLIVVLIFSLFSSCSSMGTGGIGAIAASSYTAEDQDINNAELVYTEWETDLQMQIDNAEADHPGYDEYRYHVGNIGHNPFELMGFLTASYQAFQYADVEAVLQELFAEQYSLKPLSQERFNASVERLYGQEVARSRTSGKRRKSWIGLEYDPKGGCESGDFDYALGLTETPLLADALEASQREEEQMHQAPQQVDDLLDF